MSRVFILEPAEYSVQKAKPFGRIVFMFGDREAHAPANTKEFVSQVRARLEELKFRPHVDYFAIVGPMMAVAITASVIAAEHREVMLLCFDNGTRSYAVLEVTSAVSKENQDEATR